MITRLHRKWQVKVKLKSIAFLVFILCPVKRKLAVGQSQRPGEEDQDQEPEQAWTDLSFAEDVLPTTLHVRVTHSVLYIVFGPFPIYIDYGITYSSSYSLGSAKLLTSIYNILFMSLVQQLDANCKEGSKVKFITKTVWINLTDLPSAAQLISLTCLGLTGMLSESSVQHLFF